MVLIREMTLKDCGAVAEIDKNTFSVSQSKEGYEREYSNPNSRTFVAESEGRIIGFANVWNICGDVSLNNLAVIPEERSNGVGTLLLKEVLNRYRGCDFVTLEVRKSNEGAIRFYKRFGFRQVGLRKDFYTLPTEDALLMTVFLEEWQG